LDQCTVRWDENCLDCQAQGVSQWSDIHLVTGDNQRTPKSRPGLIAFNTSMNNPDDNMHNKPMEYNRYEWYQLEGEYADL